MHLLSRVSLGHPVIPSRAVCLSCRRALSATSTTQSGHSRWATIKHDKAVNDSRKSKQRSQIAKELSSASKLFGPDPQSNNRLAVALGVAKRAGIPKSTIDGAIARGQGKSTSGAALETLTVEAMQGQVGWVVECLTDSKARALQEMRKAMRDHGAEPAPTMFLFERRGRVAVKLDDGQDGEEWLDKVMEAVMEEEVLDVVEAGSEEEGRLVVVDADASATKAVEKKVVDELGLELESSETIWFAKPDTRVDAVSQAEASDFTKLYDWLQDYPGVQGVYTNLDNGSLNRSEGLQEPNT